MSEQSVSDVRAYSKSTGFAKFLLVIIASHLHPKAVYAYPSLDTLARETTLSKPTVIRLIKVLEALGELEFLRGRGRGHSNRYRITIAHEAIPDRPAEDEIDQPKGKAPSDHHPATRLAEDNDDHPKGKPYLYLLPNEKVNRDAEKVNGTPLKGKPSVDSKEVLRTSKEEREKNVYVDVDRSRGEGNDHAPDPEPLDPAAADLVEQCIEWFDDAHSRPFYHRAMRIVGAQVFYALMLYTWEQRARIHCLGAYLTTLLKRSMARQGVPLGRATVTLGLEALPVVTSSPARPEPECGRHGCHQPQCPHTQFCQAHACCEECGNARL